MDGGRKGRLYGILLVKMGRGMLGCLCRGYHGLGANELWFDGTLLTDLIFSGPLETIPANYDIPLGLYRAPALCTRWSRI